MTEALLKKIRENIATAERLFSLAEKDVAEAKRAGLDTKEIEANLRNQRLAIARLKSVYG